MRTGTEPLDIWEHESRGWVAVVTGVRTPSAGEPQVFLRDVETGDPLQFTDQDMYYRSGFRCRGSWEDDEVRTSIDHGEALHHDPEELVENDDLPVYDDGG